MKKQTLLLIGLGIVLIAMANKKEKPKSKVIINELEPSNSGGFNKGFPISDTANLLSSLFNRKPTKNEASQIVTNWKGFNPFN